jgi:hypothetical protein
VIRPKQPTTGFGSRSAVPILTAFKTIFPDWSQTDWSEVYVEITEVDITVRNLARASVTDGETIQFSDPDLSQKLQATIAQMREIAPT